MMISKTPKIYTLCLLMALVSIFFSCFSGTGKSSEQNKNEQNFSVPKLLQQAISSKESGDREDYGLYYVFLETFKNQQDNTNLMMTAFVRTVTKGSFSTFSDGILWIGEFTSRDGSYTAPAFHHLKTADGNINHGWMAGFILDMESGSEKYRSSALNPQDRIDILNIN